MAAAERYGSSAAADAPGAGGAADSGKGAESFRSATYVASKAFASELVPWLLTQTQVHNPPAVGPGSASAATGAQSPADVLAAALQPLLLRPVCEGLWWALAEGALKRRPGRERQG